MGPDVELSVSRKSEAALLLRQLSPVRHSSIAEVGRNTPPKGGTPNVRADGRLCPVARDPFGIGGWSRRSARVARLKETVDGVHPTAVARSSLPSVCHLRPSHAPPGPSGSVISVLPR